MQLKAFIWYSCWVIGGLGFNLSLFANVPQASEFPQSNALSHTESLPISQAKVGSKYEIGEPVLLLGYESATLLKIEHNGIKVMHHQGVALVRTEHLSQELRSRYELDNAEKVEERMLARGEQLYQARRAQALELSQQMKFRITGKVLQVLSDRLLIHSAKILAGKEPEVTRQRTGRHVIGTGPSLRHPDGVPVFEEIEKVVWKDAWLSLGGVVIIKCPTKGIVDDTRFEMEMYYLGTISYTTREEREKTVYHFGTDINDAISFAMHLDPSELPDFIQR